MRSLEHADRFVVTVLGTLTFLRPRRTGSIGCRVGTTSCSSLRRAAALCASTVAAVGGTRACLQGNNGRAEEGQRPGKSAGKGRDPGLLCGL